MSVFRPFQKAAGAIHYLDIIGGLSDDRTIPLLVSPQVLYVLNNLSALDVQMECRWATAKAAGGYLRLTTDDTEYPLFLEVVDEVGRQLSERVAGMGTLLNYRESLLTQTSEDNAQAGTNALSIGGPGNDEVWVIDRVTAFNASTAIDMITVSITNGSTLQLQGYQAAPAVGIGAIVDGPIRLSDGLEVIAYFFGCNAGDDLYLQISGYIMDRVQA
jgi:hypothetical protein